MDDSNPEQIANLNDEFRRTTATITMTRGAIDLPAVDGLISAVRRDTHFTEDNDPDREHNFGVLQWRGQVVWWKIDYYDQELEGGEDPLSPKCRRVLTVLLPDEW